MHFLFTPEQRSLISRAREFAATEVKPSAAARDEHERFDRGLFDRLGELGLTGIPWPKLYGGLGMDFVAYTGVMEELSRACASTGVMLSVHTSLVGWSLHQYGSEKQKRTFLQPMAQGRKLGAYSLTESGSGSDAGAMRTTAVRQDGSYILNGTKIFVTNAGEADIYLVFAVTDFSQGTKGCSAFIVEKGTPGFQFGKKEKKLGIRSSPTRELIFDNCRLPAENLLGPEGEGLKIALAALDGGRIGIAAQAVGIAQAALDETITFAKTRPCLSHAPGMEEKLADMAAQVDAARLLTYQAAWRESAGMAYRKYSALAKLQASDAAMRVTTEAVQLLAQQADADTVSVERYFRDAKVTQIYEGTNEIQRLVISRMLFADSTQPRLREEGLRKVDDNHFPGLENVIASETVISYLDVENEEIVLRGYDLMELARKATYVDLVALLLDGGFPTAERRTSLEDKLKSEYGLPVQLYSILQLLPHKAHMMDVLRTGISALACFEEELDDRSLNANYLRAVRLLAKVPEIVANGYRAVRKMPFIEPRRDLSYTANILYMITGQVPEALEEQVFDQCLMTYSEHELPNSTFAARVIASTHSDMYGALTGAVASLKGTLHGGANEAVMYMLQEAASEEDLEALMLDKLARKERIMGFGHRVYMSKADPRAILMKDALAHLAKENNQLELYNKCVVGEFVMKREKNLYPNLDYYAAPVLHLLGIPTDLFTPVFLAARTVGIGAHVMEQHENNRLFRPRVLYKGPRNLHPPERV